ncbi:hypothetical protein [Bernardetia sp.]|uniref:hypothetical protein n=1 Tax=Bernardetia sp. TaxID=1937974 RepID=UPI0025B9D338|nr:hypothetical protein [Bernardetia sp.]
MPLTIKDIIQNRLPFLNYSDTTVDARLDKIISEVQWTLQKPLGKDDADVELEASYSQQEIILIGVYVAYLVVLRKAFTTLAGDTETSEEASAKTLKKAKADVVEAEFHISKASDGSSIQLDTETLLASLKKEICDTAALLGITLVICQVCKKGLPFAFRVNQW